MIIGQFLIERLGVGSSGEVVPREVPSCQFHGWFSRCRFYSCEFLHLLAVHTRAPVSPRFCVLELCWLF